jgi:hypothetical protein
MQPCYHATTFNSDLEFFLLELGDVENFQNFRNRKFHSLLSETKTFFQDDKRPNRHSSANFSVFLTDETLLS